MTQEFTISHTADSLEEGETISAAMYTFPLGIVQRFCYACVAADNPRDDAAFLRRAVVVGEYMGEHAPRVEVLTEKYDCVWSNNADLFLGERCDTCHTRLGNWMKCTCGWIGWGDEGHVCTLMESDHELWEDVLNGFETGYVED